MLMQAHYLNTVFLGSLDHTVDVSRGDAELALGAACDDLVVLASAVVGVQSDEDGPASELLPV